MAASRVGVAPRYLRATYLTNEEALLRETRSTKLYYFPGPVILLALLLLLDDSALTLRAGFGSFPLLTSAYGNLPTIAGNGPSSYLLELYLLLTLLAALWLLVRTLRWMTTVYAVTSARVIIQRGILSRDFDEIPVNQVRGIDVHQTIGERLLGYGTVTVSSEGGHSIGNEAWKGIPKPFQFQRLVEGASEYQRSGPSTMTSTGTPGTVLIRPPGSP